MNQLANLLKWHRKAANLTQKQLSQQINFSHTVISRAENPDSGYLPTRAYIRQFCASLDLSAEDALKIEAAYEALLGEKEQRAALEDGAAEAAQARVSPQPAAVVRPRSRWGGVWEGLAVLGAAVLLFFVIAFTPRGSLFAKANTLNAPSGTILYSTNFDNRDLTGWDFLNSGTWEVYDRGENAVFGVIDPDPLAVPNAFFTPSLTWEDYSVILDVSFQAGVYEQIYVVVRNGGAANNCSGYRVGGNRLGVSIFRFDSNGDCQGELLAENLHYPLDDRKSYHMRIDAQGSSIRYYVDDDLVLQARDDHYLQGGLGLLAYEVRWAAFDNIRVEKR